MAGTYVTSARTTSKTTMNGMASRNTAPTGCFAIAHAVSSTEATGGVCWPMARLSVTMIPKCVGSIPSWRTSGMTMGTINKMAAALCKNIPAISRKMLSRSSTMVLLLLIGQVPSQHGRCGQDQHDGGGLHDTVERQCAQLAEIHFPVDERPNDKRGED